MESGSAWWRSPVRQVLLLLSIVCFLFSFSLPIEWFGFEASQFHSGQYWRAFTAWLTQLNLRHWMLNQWGVVAMWMLLPKKISRFDIAGFILVWLGASVLLALSNYQNYVGLSGLLYGWLIFAAVISPYYHWPLKVLFIGVLSGKVIMENLGIQGLDQDWVGEFIAGNVAHESHFWGWIMGVVMICVRLGYMQFRSKIAPLD